MSKAIAVLGSHSHQQTKSGEQRINTIHLLLIQNSRLMVLIGDFAVLKLEKQVNIRETFRRSAWPNLAKNLIGKILA